ncbi:bifunctional metallophosphatase/5'-nucleotidase [Rhodobacteraceae bacterium HSP-20]|uniref:Bifunctional metallophosphatase/5'-nucleotidase n=1 Tax=Paragemmobacter amnigenus TaxID=2852097 RepID=A0ABS6J5R9_9RHOB|nr:5'-nucleotidase C-terminal domain-containing protein [Rhodobacter amnigenus]MBU9698852.1 bifunctional metallophosphatase/5'-nucleotidase [Rhodobacter amnigenus]MBV4390079.1 bifunctional metallophosphatase/5'-nucleotidase [Rhodobacter amnigenus]
MPRITLLQINDTHGYLEPHLELVWTDEGPSVATMGGFARIATILAAARAEAPDAVLVFDNGDTFHGTPAVTQSRGEAAVPVLNALGLSAMTGHWDFAYGPVQAARLAEMLGYPLLAANCHREADDAPRFRATLTCSAGGVRIGVIGLAATILDKTMPPSFSTGLRFTDGIEETRDHALRLRADGCALIVVLSHLGLPQDAALAQAVDGIDVILSGHTHNRLEEPWIVNGALIIQSGCHGSFVGRLDLDIDGGCIVGHRHRLIPVSANLPEDPRVAELVTRAVAPEADLRGQVVGQTDRLLHRATCMDSPMDDALLAAIAFAAGTKIAFSNGWRYGAPIPPGPVTLHDLWCIIPVNPPVGIVSLSGAEIVEMLEASLDAVFATDPFDQRGGYVKRFCGLTVNAKLENPKGHRIEMIFDAEGNRLHDDKSYRAAFVTKQGVPTRFGRDRRELEIAAVDALREWFGADRPMAVSPGRLRIV